MKGWYHESYRHSLAARGLTRYAFKTNRSRSMVPYIHQFNGQKVKSKVPAEIWENIDISEKIPRDKELKAQQLAIAKELQAETFPEFGDFKVIERGKSNVMSVVPTGSIGTVPLTEEEEKMLMEQAPQRIIRLMDIKSGINPEFTRPGDLLNKMRSKKYTNSEKAIFKDEFMKRVYDEPSHIALKILVGALGNRRFKAAEKRVIKEEIDRREREEPGEEEANIEFIEPGEEQIATRPKKETGAVKYQRGLVSLKQASERVSSAKEEGEPEVEAQKYMKRKGSVIASWTPETGTVEYIGDEE